MAEGRIRDIARRVAEREYGGPGTPNLQDGFEQGVFWALMQVHSIVEECWPHGQYERFDEHHLARRLRELGDVR
jgi:hypothetical protein